MARSHDVLVAAAPVLEDEDAVLELAGGRAVVAPQLAGLVQGEDVADAVPVEVSGADDASVARPRRADPDPGAEVAGAVVGVEVEVAGGRVAGQEVGAAVAGLVAGGEQGVIPLQSFDSRV
ncbi:hypothetical protein GCM10010510_22460 [Streptomyces anandii JCM 4720]|nr:hypothetical protein GCM10010510_22460 [Streptomyces anandii JCM 4720]